MPITSKYSDQKIEEILAEIATVLEKHDASPDLTLMIAGNIVTNVLNQNVSASQRKELAEKFSQALLSSLDLTTH
ncbi:YejL family protein [Vibrio sp. S4M6]|uniref:DUF1414 domain-containing protein n=1 Tax=Vibrio sinus TaxID=2946865 RepID=UPI00202A5486|nr:YejL family protein [Vibrio sinus]MCL9783705.1 YejL family protein [Vibrio sinus]